MGQGSSVLTLQADCSGRQWQRRQMDGSEGRMYLGGGAPAGPAHGIPEDARDPLALLTAKPIRGKKAKVAASEAAEAELLQLHVQVRGYSTEVFRNDEVKCRPGMPITATMSAELIRWLLQCAGRRLAGVGGAPAAVAGPGRPDYGPLRCAADGRRPQRLRQAERLWAGRPPPAPGLRSRAMRLASLAFAS